VRDTGMGMNEEQRQRLFRPFTQAEGSAARRFGGTGLGLAISKELVGRMGGAIEVVSEPAAGSTFSFELELGVGPARGAALPRPDLRGLRVLVVDDNRSAREILERSLNSLSFRATALASGALALEELEAAAARGEPYDLVLVDWQMPFMDGIETARRIKANARLPRRPLIFMITAYGREEVMHKAAEVAPDAFLFKPVSRSVLIDAIVRALRLPEAPHKREARAAPRWEELRGQRVLVVEDNEINQRVAREILEDAGLVVEMAASGFEALEVLRQGHARFRAVLMDVQMPGMDGYQTTRAIRAELHLPLPIIALTAHAFESERRKSLESGMDDHVTKPIDPDVLLAVLANRIARDGRAPES
jgi:CheY-like chemotaxis protein